MIHFVGHLLGCLGDMMSGVEEAQHHFTNLFLRAA